MVGELLEDDSFLLGFSNSLRASFGGLCFGSCCVSSPEWYDDVLIKGLGEHFPPNQQMLWVLTKHVCKTDETKFFQYTKHQAVIFDGYFFTIPKEKETPHIWKLIIMRVRSDWDRPKTGMAHLMCFFLQPKQSMLGQWSFLVPLIGGRYHIITQLTIYKWYISGIIYFMIFQMGWNHQLDIIYCMIFLLGKPVAQWCFCFRFLADLIL